MEAVQTKDNDLRDKIKTFLVKLDKMEERVKDVENVSKALPRLESQLAKVILRVDEVVARVEKGARSSGSEETVKEKTPYKAPPPPVQAFVGGATVAMLIVGAVVVAWLLGLF